MVGNAAEAEDIIQDVWLRWQIADRRTIENAAAYLAKTTARLCINLSHSAQSRHETCVSTWSPEPSDIRSDPTRDTDLNEALQVAVLLLLQNLTPNERAAYVLREAFDYSYSHIASIVNLEEANVRQLVSRARKHIGECRRSHVSFSAQRRLLKAFLAAAQHADMAALENLFAEEAPSVSHAFAAD